MKTSIYLAAAVLLGSCASEIGIQAPKGISIAVGVNVVEGFTVKAAPKTTANVNHYSFHLFSCGVDTVCGNGDDGAAVAVGDSVGEDKTSTFTTVPDGKYYLAAQAWEDAGETISISQGGLVANAADSVTVASPNVTYAPADGALNVTLTLLDGTGESVSNSLTVNNGSAWAGAIGFTP